MRWYDGSREPCDLLPSVDLSTADYLIASNEIARAAKCCSLGKLFSTFWLIVGVSWSRMSQIDSIDSNLVLELALTRD